MSNLELGEKEWEGEEAELSLYNQRNLVEQTFEAIKRDRMTDRGKLEAYENLKEIEGYLEKMQYLKSSAGDTPELLSYIVNEGTKAEKKTNISTIKWKLRRIIQLAKQVLMNFGYYSYAYPEKYSSKYKTSELSQNEMDSMSIDEAYEYALKKRILDTKRELENREKLLAMKLGESDAEKSLVAGELVHRGKVSPYVSLDGTDIYDEHHRRIVSIAESMLNELRAKRQAREEKKTETLAEKRKREEQELSQKIRKRAEGVIKLEKYMRARDSV